MMLQRRLESAAGNAPPRRLSKVHSRVLAIQLVVLGGVATLANQAPAAVTQETVIAQVSRDYAIPAGPLSSVLTRFATESGIFVVGASDAAAGKRSPGLQGRYTLRQALEQLLGGSGISYRFSDDRTVMLVVDRAEAATAQLDRVAVTAKGYAADVLETPAATLVLDRDALARRNAANVGDALRGQPGLAVASDGAHGQNPVIRGLKKESLVLLVDGMRLNSAQPAGAIASMMSLGLAERVEVVKGTASVLYGTGALGGAINVLLPQARFEPGLAADFTASLDSASNGVRGAGVMNFADGDHALMLGLSLARIDDYDAPGGEVERTGYDSNAAIGQYRLRLDEAQQLRLSLQWQKDTDAWFPGSKKPHPHPLIDFTTVHSPETERRLYELGYTLEKAAERPLNLDVRLYRQEMRRQIYAFAEPLNRELAQTQVSFDTNGLDLRVDWELDSAHLLSFGANAWRMSASPQRYLRNMASPPDFPFVRNDPFEDARIDALGIYLQDDIKWRDLNLTAGIRHDTVKGTADSVGNPPVTTGLDRRDSAVSGSLGAIYAIDPLLRPYVNLSRGFRAAGMRERYEASPRGDGFFHVGNPQTAPEIAHQVEIGLKGADRRLSYSLSAYHNRISDYITGQDISGTPAAVAACGPANAAACKRTVNLGSVTLTGIEAEVRWEAVPGHWLSLAYSRVRGTNEDLDEPLFQMPADELSLGWDGRIAPGLTADATLRIVRDQDRVATVFSRGSEDPTDGFVTADVGLTWAYARNQSLRFMLTNIADKAYHEHLAEGVAGQEIEAPGRSLQLVWRGTF